METKTAFVGADGSVELNSESTVHLHHITVVNPRYTEMNQPLWLDHSLHDGDVLRVRFQNGLQRFQDFFHSLVKLGLVGIS